MKKYLLFLLIVFSAGSITFSQDTTNLTVRYLPDIYGILKTKIEYDLDNELMRFEVRNARFGVQGKINDYMSYKMQIDLSDEGRMKMLDAYIRYDPFDNFFIYLGQKKIPFSTDYMRNPAENIFANRSFLSKYINNGLRDIGLYAEYKTGASVPLEILFGAVNGTGNNNPQWITRPNLAGRIIAGPLEGFRIAGNMYFGEAEFKDNLAMFGGEIRYSKAHFFIESEYIRRNWTDTLSLRNHDDGLYIHSYYNFIRGDKVVNMITPVARLDFMGKSVFSGAVDASRMTLGVNIGFLPKQFHSEIRFNYENYFKSSLPIHTDKITVEFIARF